MTAHLAERQKESKAKGTEAQYSLDKEHNGLQKTDQAIESLALFICT